MKKYLLVAALMLTLVFVPKGASAHERQVFDINGTKYLFVIGSLNEPVVVDDKTGVDLRVKIADPNNPGDSASTLAKPVNGLDQTLKVEMLAGGKRKIVSLAPAYNDPGAYKTTFYPSVQTTLSYRVFGEINSTPVDLTFTCNPAGHPAAAEDASVVKLTDKVSRTLKVGAFGCPISKSELGFPEPAPTLVSLDQKSVFAGVVSTNGGVSSRTAVSLALTLSVLALIVGLAGLRKRM